MGLGGERPLQKNDISFVTEEAPEGGFRSRCTFSCLPELGSYEGETQPSKKLAENSAAEVAVAALEPQFAPLQEEHMARKKQKNAENLAKMKEKEAAKKAEKEAEAEAGE